MTNLSDFISLVEYLEKVGGILLPENFHWTKDISMLMPKIDLDLPSMQKTYKIVHVLDKKNPIYVGLSDGGKLFFTHDEFRRINKKPEKGKNITVVLQRHHNDVSELPSIITKCMVH